MFGKRQSAKSGWFRGSGEPDVHQQILLTLDDWVAHHPNPDAPAISLAGLGEYSPREIAHAVSEENDAGHFFEALIVNGARVSENGLSGVLRSFREEGGNSWLEIGEVVNEDPGAASAQAEPAREGTEFNRW